jgi:signal transduction histidine kinase
MQPRSMISRQGFRRLTAVLIVSSIPMFGLIDKETGPDYGFSLLYLVPIVVLARWYDRGLALVAAALAGTFWVLTELGDQVGAGQVNVLAVAWNGLTRFVIYVGAAYLVALQRRERETAEAAVRARERFLSIAAHELRGPVSAMSARVQLALRRLDRAEGPTSIRPQLEMLLAAARRLEQVTRNLFDVEQIERGRLTLRPERFDLAALVREVAGLVNVRLGPERVVQLDAPDELLMHGDPLRIEQIIANLLDNALKFSHDGKNVDVLVVREGDHIRLAVRDHGIGIAPEARERIFEPRYQERPTESPGMGIGLAVVRQIVLLHGGDVTVDPADGGGSIFTVRLPTCLDDLGLEHPQLIVANGRPQIGP